ncbi:MAG: hypothetical protein ACRD1T_26820, partial [Acidimicrobiia bacterium]
PSDCLGNLVVRAFRWALGTPQLPHQRSEVYFPTTLIGTPSCPYGFPRAAHSVPGLSLTDCSGLAQIRDHKKYRQEVNSLFLRAFKSFFAGS